MRYILIFVGAAVVAYFLAMGIRVFVAGRNTQCQQKDEADTPQEE